MKYRHATTQVALDGVQRDGQLDPLKSQGKRLVLWLHTASRTPWAILHTIGRHQQPMEQIVILEIDLPRSWVRRAQNGLQNGLWTCARPIGAHRITKTTLATEWSRSPITEG